MCSEWRQPRPFNQYQKSTTLLSNSQTFVQPMNNSVVRAWEMFNSRAYLHQYEKYGLEVDDFIDSFGTVEQIISDYSKICEYLSLVNLLHGLCFMIIKFIFGFWNLMARASLKRLKAKKVVQ